MSIKGAGMPASHPIVIIVLFTIAFDLTPLVVHQPLNNKSVCPQNHNTRDNFVYNTRPDMQHPQPVLSAQRAELLLIA